MQPGNQEYCHETGKQKNCGSWAKYELPNTSETAKLCHGGVYITNGAPRMYTACPSREECRRATQITPENEPRRLPILNPGTRPPAPLFTHPAYRPVPQGLPTSLPAAPRPTQYSYGEYEHHQAPRPIQPPPEYPASMQTPYVPATDGWGAPTFLPREGEGALERLAKNLIQAILAVIGYQLYNFMRSIDLFRFV